MGATSIRFRRGESEWAEDSSVSGESHPGSRDLVEEVLSDVLHAPPAVEEDANGSDDDNDCHEFDLGQNIFMVASDGGGPRPAHWTAADDDAVEDGPAHLDLRSLMGSAGSSVGSAGSSVLWDRMEDLKDLSSRHSTTTEVSPLTERRRRRFLRRRLFARRCAKILAGMAALAALGGSVGYFILAKGQGGSVESFFMNIVAGRWFGAGEESLEEREEDPPAHRTLPAGKN